MNILFRYGDKQREINAAFNAIDRILLYNFCLRVVVQTNYALEVWYIEFYTECHLRQPATHPSLNQSTYGHSIWSHEVLQDRRSL